MGIVLFWQPRWLLARLARRSPEVVYFVETTEPVVALTFDDGPDPETTPELLRVLASYQARATFFLITSRVAGNERIVSQIVEAGHELGNHLTHDEPSIHLTPREFEKALVEAHDVLAEFAPVRWLRPAGGRYNDTMLSIIKAHDYRCALGSLYPYDAFLPFPRFAVRQVLTNVRPGSIVILHDAGPRGRRTASVLHRVLPELHRRGFRVVTLSELADPRNGG